MEEDQEQRFVCRFCNKKCFSGKSLGGHMRGHLALISAAKKGKSNRLSNLGSDDSYVLEDEVLSKKSDQKMVSEEGDADGSLNQEKLFKSSDMEVEGGYGLREKPKKSWKIDSDLELVAAASSLTKRNNCRECGKGFPSVRALAGHMRCHPVRKRERFLCKKCDRDFDSMRALFGHMKRHSKKSRLHNDDDDDEPAESTPVEFTTLCPTKRKRSRTRYKINSPNITFSSLNNASSSSSFANEIEEVEHVAMCLMMLSRGLKNWDDFNSPIEFAPKKDSSIFEAESFDQYTGIAMGDDGGVSGDDETGKKLIVREKLNPGISSAGNGGPEGVITSLGDFVSGYESGAELDHNNEFGPDSAADKWEKDPSYDVLESAKKPEYKCKTCGKLFNSHQGLGGHRNKHKGESSSSASMEENKVLPDFGANFKLDCPDSSMDPLEAEATGSEMSKEHHQCPVCFKVFPSGQALGGHKRAHYVGYIGSKAIDAFRATQENPDFSEDFHLDLALTADGGNKDQVAEKLWWAGRSSENEALMLST